MRVLGLLFVVRVLIRVPPECRLTIGLPLEVEVDWRWSGLEKKMKWIGLEWRKGGEIGEKSCPKPTPSLIHI